VYQASAGGTTKDAITAPRRAPTNARTSVVFTAYSLVLFLRRTSNATNATPF